MKIVSVGIDVPVAKTFDYLAEDVSDDDIGERVLVPFGTRRMIGVVLGITDRSAVPSQRLKPVVRMLRGTKLSDDDLRLLRFASEYYHYPLGQVAISALPLRLRRLDAAKTVECEYALTPHGATIPLNGLAPRATVKRKLLETFQSQRALSPTEVRHVAASAPGVLKEFLALGWVELRELTTTQRAIAETVVAAAWPLTAAQARASDAICARLDGYGAFLLSGVTGSGKTEVYLRVAESVLRRGRQVLLLVPEIALTPQLEAMVQARFPETLLVSLHSGLNEAERLRNWTAAQKGEARIVLGTRLAVFTPLPELGFIAVDEEHDASFKQTDGFCYSARDLAVVRASQRNVPVVRGSATPSLETYHNATTGRYALLDLPERINARPPRIECVPMRGIDAKDGLAPALVTAIGERLERAEQTLIFINRRGYAPVLMCHACGWLSGCQRCSALLVLHMPQRELHCHHCGHRERVAPACPQCGNPALAPVGQGTQRVEASLALHFPEARILRIDRDSTRRKHAWNEMRERIRARDVDILVGTQILAKGHDFPHLALVGVLNADSMLYSADFRASERLYALLTQVAGRAGRGDAEGQVLIQTEFPAHPIYAALRSQDFASFAQSLLAERRGAGFPPFVHQALLRAEAAKVETALDFLRHAQEIGRALDGVELYDPVPAAMVRLAGRERAQLLVESASRPALHAFLGAWRDLLASDKTSGARWTLEIDPLEI